MSNRISINTRISSMFFDHLISSLIAIVFSLPLIIIQNNVGYGNIHYVALNKLTVNVFFYLSLFGFSTYPCKDSVNGKSIAKRNFKLAVVDNKSGEPATPFQCFLRNIFCIIWPIELIITLINVNRRIGDFVAGTRVEHDTEKVNLTLNYWKIIMVILISYILFLLIFRNYNQFIFDMFNPIHNKNH